MNREIDIRQYWTNIVKNIGEFQQIAEAENPEFNSLTGILTRCLSETFVKDASEYGVKRFEKMLDIIPVKSATLEERKVNILTLLNLKLPYTWRMLEGSIEAFVGEDNYTLSLDELGTVINLEVVVNSDIIYRDIINFLDNVLPKNIELNLTRGLSK